MADTTTLTDADTNTNHQAVAVAQKRKGVAATATGCMGVEMGGGGCPVQRLWGLLSGVVWKI